MNFRDLEYVIETAKTLSFSKAALNCNVSQPSLSSQIKKLEEELGVVIFHRSKRSVALTSYGEVFIEKAHKILSIKEQVENLAQDHKDPVQGTLRLGGIMTIAPYMFPQIVNAIEAHAPKIKLKLSEGKTETLLKDLLANRIDAALISLPTDQNVFETRSLFVEPFYLAVPNSHELSGRKEVDDSDLHSKELILLGEGHCFRTQALDVCHSASAKENQVFSGASLETVRQFLMRGDGMTLIPAMARQNNDGIAYIPMKNKKYAREVGLVWRRSCNKKLQIEKMISMIEFTRSTA